MFRLKASIFFGLHIGVQAFDSCLAFLPFFFRGLLEKSPHRSRAQLLGLQGFRVEEFCASGRCSGPFRALLGFRLVGLRVQAFRSQAFGG